MVPESQEDHWIASLRGEDFSLTDDDISIYLIGAVRGGPGWHFCYLDGVGRWSMDPSCPHRTARKQD
jgi:hypothetical protein